MQPDTAIIGGGVVGLCVAHGLAQRGGRVTVVDGGDRSLRASRGNFGLVWVQGKGLHAPAYARWTRTSAAGWRGFADELARETGIDVALRQQGGYDFHFDEAGLEARGRAYRALGAELGGDYPFEVLGANALKREEPEIGPKVAGAILHHEDGHVNPLRLLKALARAVRQRGVTVRTGAEVETIDQRPGGGFRLGLHGGGTIEAERVVICAGLGAARLAAMVGLKAPVRPQRGEILITGKLPKLMNRPSGIIRQVDEGGVQVGDSHENVGLDDGDRLDVAAAMAARAVVVYPALAKAHVVRGWGALRILTPDGLPIYQRSAAAPGAFLMTCHSGITLASVHARLLPAWIDGAADAPNLEAFGEQRFAV